MLESAFAMLLHHAFTQYPARAARQWIPPSIPPPPEARAAGEWIRGSRRVSRQSSSPVYPAEHPARESCRVSRQSGLSVDPAEYPACQWILAKYPTTRTARQWIPPSIPLSMSESLRTGSRRIPPSIPLSIQSSSPVIPAEYSVFR